MLLFHYARMFTLQINITRQRYDDMFNMFSAITILRTTTKKLKVRKRTYTAEHSQWKVKQVILLPNLAIV